MNYIQLPMPLVEPKELRVLVLSDSHNHGGYFNKLSDWLKTFNPSYDIVILLGNSTNMVNKLRNDYLAESQAAEQINGIIQFLNEYVKKPVVYIPGNTEPTGIYTFAYDIPGAMNLHKRAMQLDEGLVLVGLGGSLPVKKDEKDVLEGYPYEKAEDFGKDLSACLDTAVKTFGPETSYILLTHIGPSESITTEVYLKNDSVNGGFKGFGDLVKGKGIIGHIHGHSVNSEGLTKPFDISMPVINPGGLVNGKFGELTLRRDMSGKWKIGEVQFRSLD